MAREGNLDYAFGDSGRFVVQTHERFLLEYQIKYTHDLGWKRVFLSPSQLNILRTIADFNWDKINDPKIHEDKLFIQRLNKFVEGLDIEDLNVQQLKVLALVNPVSIHTDIRFHRLRPKRDDYFEGGEIFKPGNQFHDNPLLVFEEEQPFLFDFKKGREKELEAEGSKELVEVVKGPLDWMKIGKDKPYIARPGTPGADEKHWGRLTMRDEGRWWAGTQDRHHKEFWLEGKWLKGCYQFNYVPTGPGVRQWMMIKVKNRTKEQVLSKQK